MSGEGVWRGTVKAMRDGRPLVEVPRLSPGHAYGPCEAAAGLALVEGDRVLVAFVEGRLDDLVVLAKLP